MRVVILVLILALAGFTAHAVSYSNDSDSVDIDYIAPTPINPPDTNTNTGGGGSGGGAGTGNGGGSSGGNGPVSITISVNGSGTFAGQEGSELGEDILRSLFGNQAAIFGLGGGSEFDYDVTLQGDAVRRALVARGVSELEIADLLTSRFLSRKDFTLVAASSILKNKRLESVILSLDTLTLTYRAQGRLLAVFPLSYPVKVTINPNATSADARIIIKFPWYRFFLQTFVTKTELMQELNVAIDRGLAASQESKDSIDAKTKLFLSVSNAISSRFDTVDGTLK